MPFRANTIAGLDFRRARKINTKPRKKWPFFITPNFYVKDKLSKVKCLESTS